MLKKTLVVTLLLPDELESRITRDNIARFNAKERFYSSDELIGISPGADTFLGTQQDVMDARSAAATVETRIRIGMRELDNLDAALASMRPENLVTPAVASSR